MKLVSEKRDISHRFDKIKAQVQQSEQERFDFEVEKFKKQQEVNFQGKKSDIERLQEQKRKLQNEYQTKTDQIRQEQEKKLGLEKRQIIEQNNREL